MSGSKKLVAELCQVVRSFICQPGVTVDLWQCSVGPHVFAKGSTQPICIVKLVHGHIYNLEFVYRYWCHLLEAAKFPYSPVFIISNNGLASTLKCFLCEPMDLQSQFGRCLCVDTDVYLPKNSSVVLSQDDFTKFKTNLVFSKDLNVFNSMVVCRTYLTDSRQALQFLVVKAKNPKRVSAILGMIAETLGLTSDTRSGGEGESASDEKGTWDLVRRPIRAPETLVAGGRPDGESLCQQQQHHHQQLAGGAAGPGSLLAWTRFASGRYVTALAMGAAAVIAGLAGMRLMG
ncbi:nuclear egress membrane protein [Equid gammaherpesvirus 5]|uniref:Nuclear egress membrane protein n=1 Tax=Equid gammaherpesvirus 5 TaxID=10371 RepID=A0A0B4Q5L4_9GAMA|nr:nuclear egress membrane protein [Equid gammaherpesvirus 5]AIU39592.1 nuclear egress membrane protein [Equid gammaherpesvirus 5]APT43409.1 nuclear egress membrane protein [Equid gammaherpesvirus 5]